MIMNNRFFGSDGWAWGGALTHPIYTHYLGTGLNDGEWQYVEIEVAELVSAIAGHTVDLVEGIGFTGKDVYVDDVIISGSELYRAYQVNTITVHADEASDAANQASDEPNEASSVAYEASSVVDEGIFGALPTSRIAGKPN